MLYFIKGDSPKNWGATKLKLTKGASPSAVIAGMEKEGWKSVTVSAFNAWRKQNSRPTQDEPDGAKAAATLSGLYNCGCCGLEKCSQPGICDDCLAPPTEFEREHWGDDDPAPLVI